MGLNYHHQKRFMFDQLQRIVELVHTVRSEEKAFLLQKALYQA